MPPDFVVRINRRDGVVEIEGSDKEWIAEQISRLSVVYEHPPGPTATVSSTPPPAAATTSGSVEKPKAAGSQATSPTRTRRTGGRSTRASRKPELETALTSEVRTALQSYIEERSSSWTSKADQAAIIATFLMDNVGWDGWIDPDDLYTVYSVMGWQDMPSNFRSQINNARQRNGYFGAWVSGRAQLTHGGEQFGRHGSKGS